MDMIAIPPFTFGCSLSAAPVLVALFCGCMCFLRSDKMNRDNDLIVVLTTVFPPLICAFGDFAACKKGFF